MEPTLVKETLRKDHTIKIFKQADGKFQYEVTDPKGEFFAGAQNFLSEGAALKDAEQEIKDNADVEDWEK